MYKIVLLSEAEKEYKRLRQRDPLLFSKLLNALNRLKSDPTLGKPLKWDLKGKWSFRIGPYRILYRIEHNKLILYVLEIGHRREIYR